MMKRSIDPAAQPFRPVEQLGDELRQPPVLVVDDADLAHPVAVARRERIADRLAQCAAQMHRAETAEPVHQPLEIAPVGQQVELDHRLGAPVARGEPDLAGLGQRLVDADQLRSDLLADRMPGRFADHRDEHVAGRRRRSMPDE